MHQQNEKFKRDTNHKKEKPTETLELKNSVNKMKKYKSEHQ